ncbi:MAG TPA: hypothetical protein VGH80_10785 [Xanthomonadaceae bacterium]|jgi:hypothetical protein
MNPDEVRPKSNVWTLGLIAAGFLAMSSISLVRGRMDLALFYLGVGALLGANRLQPRSSGTGGNKPRSYRLVGLFSVLCFIGAVIVIYANNR